MTLTTGIALAPGNRQSNPCRAITLLEVLAVTVLIAMVASAAMTNLSSVCDTAQMMSVIAGVRDLEFRGRLLAKTSGHSVVIVVDTHTNTIVLRQINYDEAVASLTTPPDVTVAMSTDRSVNQIRLDRLGHSVNYTIRIRRIARSVQLNVNGLTGVIDQSEDEQ